ncbi:hypothetical protein DAPPUDRAFT_98362 [Daphnia pulex]|uniref:Uncharacterized protein n=1 Tax=Daphnia pulex TaxID=6669 RepID=E9G3F5_DAPPU|nr:hypothetical protein DAPPUDRAFT_98362 [Daphnia pulex]|eukprot:EFX85997.1 hypothetical protein DAPPUDRAFT_98362 [Daphnia pulex]
MEVNQQDFTSSNCVTGPVINDGISTTSGEDLNNQSFLRLMAKVNEKNLIVLENERLANELSLLQSQLTTDSNSKLQMFQDVHDELAITKSELEKQKSVNTELTEINLRLTNDNSWLRRKIKDKDKLIASAPHQTYVQEDLEVPHQFTHNRTLFKPTKCHGDLLQHNSNTEEVGLRYLSVDKNPNELYPLSLLQEVRSNQKSPEKFDLLEKKDNQLKPEIRPNPEKSDFKEKKVNQTQVKPKDPHELPQNSEKYDLLEKKFNNKLLELNNEMLELNNKINFLLTPKDPHSLPQNPTEKSDLLGEKENEPQTKPEDPQVLGNPKVEQVPETHKKQSIGQNIKKSLLSAKELFQPRKQTELENNPAEIIEPDVEKSREKCVINGKTFPISNREGLPLKLAWVNYNVWKSIGKPKINQTGIYLTEDGLYGESDKDIPILGKIKVKIVINNKKSIIPILVVNNPLETNATKKIYIIK